MARLGDGEPSVSVLERLLANAALRDEAGRPRPPAAVSQGVWGVGCRESRLGPLPVPEAVPPVSRCPPPGLRVPPGAGWAEGP